MCWREFGTLQRASTCVLGDLEMLRFTLKGCIM
jgi:hypothetical protein